MTYAADRTVSGPCRSNGGLYPCVPPSPRCRAPITWVCALPTYKASYTGLLKIFLDLFPGGGLRGVTAFPVMPGAGPHHALAPELLLKPVLVELGATCPMRGLYLLDSEWETSPALDERVPAASAFVTVGALK